MWGLPLMVLPLLLLPALAAPPHGPFCSRPCASSANCSASVLPGRCTVCYPADARGGRFCGGCDCACGGGCSADSDCAGECFACIAGKCAVAIGGNCTASGHCAGGGHCVLGKCGGGGAAAATAGALLFFDGRRLASATNVERQLGEPTLLATFADPVSFVGWGYPSVWRDGENTRLIYEANFNHSHLPRVQLLAESADDVHFTLTDTTKAAGMKIGQRLRPNQILEPNVGTERGCVFDDGAAPGRQVGDHRLKMLMSNSSVFEGDASGTNWTHRPHDWAPSGMDPMISVVRDRDGRISVLSRPPKLRKGGRHAGIHSARTWDGLEKLECEQLLPIDGLYANDAEIYGLPAFSYAGMYVGFLTRMRCEPNCSWFGGHLSGELAYSYDGKAEWLRLGQNTSALPGRADELQLGDSPEAVIFPNSIAPVAAGQIYATAMQPTRNGSGLLIYASVASVQHGHGVDSTRANASCARAGAGGGGAPCSHIATFGLRKDGFVGLKQKSVDMPAVFTTVPLVWAGGDELLLNFDLRLHGRVARVELSVLSAAGAVLATAKLNAAQACVDVPAFAAGTLAKLLPKGREFSLRLTLNAGAVLYSIRGAFSVQS